MVVAFATLRGGPIPASTVIGLGLVVTFVVLGLAGLPVVSLAMLVPLCWLPTAIAAEVLRRTSNLPAAVGVIALCSFATVLVLLALQGPMDGFWQLAAERLKAVMPPVVDGENTADLQFSNAQLITLLIAGGAVTVLVLATAGLFLGRSGQARLFNPGGFQREFHALYFGKQVGLFCLALLLIGFFIGGALGISLSTIALFPLLLQGLAVMHSLVKGRALGAGWLVGLYLLLMFVQPVTLLVGGIGLLDNLKRLPRQ